MDKLIGAIKSIENSLSEKIKGYKTEDDKTDAKMALGCLADLKNSISSIKISARYAGFILKSLGLDEELKILETNVKK